MHKIDFTATAAEGEPLTDIKVGQSLVLSHQEDGTWCCNTTDGGFVCCVPAATAASLVQQQVPPPTAVIRSVKRCQDNPDAVVSFQVRISFPSEDDGPRLQQAPAPADDPSGFCLTTAELEQLACDKEVRSTLQDKRLQEVLLKIDSAPNREQALQQALGNPDFRDFADKMLQVMKPDTFL